MSEVRHVYERHNGESVELLANSGTSVRITVREAAPCLPSAGGVGSSSGASAGVVVPPWVLNRFVLAVQTVEWRHAAYDEDEDS